MNTRDWTWKAEYLYIDFGHIGASGTDTVLGTYSWNTHVTDHIARVGVNYRFH
jgi:outer membrane immunogenic protein